MSVEASNYSPPPGGLTPLATGPMPLSRTAGWAWAAFVLLGTMVFSLLIPTAATRWSAVAVPPGAVVFGEASVIPAEGWSVTSETVTSVTLSNGGVSAVFRSLPADGKSAALRVADLAEDTRARTTALTVESQPHPFSTPGRTPGQLIALAGTNQTGLVASVVDGPQAVDVVAVGELTQFGEAVSDIQQMLESIRIRSGVSDGG